MKVFSKLLIASLIFIFSCSSEESEEIACIDETKIDELALCVEIFEPVCGCDGITYANPSTAKCHGIKKYKWGKCEDKQ